MVLNWPQPKAPPGACCPRSPSSWTTSGVPAARNTASTAPGSARAPTLKQRALDHALQLVS
jgi:hypothetical protein